MLIGIDNVINWLSTNLTPYWYVKDGASEKAGLIFTAQSGDENLALEDSKAKLLRCLNTLAPGNYLIQAWESPGQKKNWNTTRFQITNANGQVPQNQQIGNGQFQNNGMNVQQMIAEALANERTVIKMERLEAEIIAKDKRIKELESELNSTEIRIGNRLDKILGPLLDIPMKHNTQSLGNIEDDGERIAATMEKWAEKDAEFEGVLNGIVKLAYENPSKYQMGKNLLK